MANVIVDKNKIDLLANAIADKSGEPVTMTLDEMVDAVDSIEVGGGITPTGNIDITQAGVTDVTNYATATVAYADAAVSQQGDFITESGTRKFRFISEGYAESAGWVDEGGFGEGSINTYNAIPTGTTVTPTESAQTIGGANVMMEGAVTVNAIPSNYVGSGVTQRSSSDLTSSTLTVTAPAGHYQNAATKTLSDPNLIASNIKNNVTIFGTTGSYTGSGGSLTVATKTLTVTATTQTLSFTSLSGQPKYWFLRATTNVSSSGSTTYYYITDLFYDGTNIKGNTFRIGSTRRVQNITSGVTQSYNNGTLTITAGSVSTATPGQFYGATSFGYELVYVY